MRSLEDVRLGAASFSGSGAVLDRTVNFRLFGTFRGLKNMPSTYIDDQTSEEVRYWMPEDGRPDRVGTCSSVSGMRIDPAKVGDAKVFRTWGWHIALIVSENIKDALERAGVTGVRFKEVTGPGSISSEKR